jgi:RNA polymerase sigma-70 factor (ECF subfamily)
VSQPPSADADSVAWLRDLDSEGRVGHEAVSRLHDFLTRVARSEAARRRERLPESLRGELDDLCVQAASDASLAVVQKLDTYRGDARFTTWAAKFVILELSSRLRRRAWHGRTISFDPSAWGRMPGGSGSPLQDVESRELLRAIERSVERDLTDRQRSVFLAVVIDEVPIDVLAERLGSSRGAIYKVLHDARRRLRDSLSTEGFLRPDARPTDEGREVRSARSRTPTNRGP